MPRILFFVFIAFLVWLAVRVLRGRADGPERPASSPTASVSIPEPILQCAWCGVHVPIGHAVTLPDGRLYCGAPHRDAAVAASADRSGA